MERRKTALLAAGMAFVLATETIAGAQGTALAATANAFAVGKNPGLKKKKITVTVGETASVQAKNISSGMKVKIKQDAASRKRVKAQWKSKKKQLFLTGKKQGKSQIKLIFTKKKKKYTSLLTVTVKNKKQPSPVVSNEPAENSPVAETPLPSPSESETPRPTSSPTPSPTPKPTYDVDALSIKDVYKDYFLVGAAINGKDEPTMALHHKGMTEILKKHFNSTTLSNLMKPEHTLDEEASKASADGMPVCKFDTCDEALQFCMDNGIKMRGHTLVWHNQVPTWFFFEDYDTEKKLVDALLQWKRGWRVTSGRFLRTARTITRVLFIAGML